MNRKYTATTAIEEINRQAKQAVEIIPTELLEEVKQRISGPSSTADQIERNRLEAIEMIRTNSDSKTFNFGRIVNQFNYGGMLRGIARKAKKLNISSPELEDLFQISTGK